MRDRKRWVILGLMVAMGCLVASCSADDAVPSAETPTTHPATTAPSPPSTIADDAGTITSDASGPTSTVQPEPSSPDPGLLQPNALVYEGAFRLPADPGGAGWEWSGEALTHNPNGDPSGTDPYPGSLFGTGHNWHQRVSEISIPAPVISPDWEGLPVAERLQPFTDITGGLLDVGSLELPRVGLEYLDERLHFTWGQHFEEDGPHNTHGWTTTDLTEGSTIGLWPIANAPRYASNDYLFAIDSEWAAVHTPGHRLATGRFRDGGWSGQGPALYAYTPGEEIGPSPGTPLPSVPLLQYGTSHAASNLTMDGYHHSDEWTGGAWVTGPAGQAVLIVGTKGLGECWYGFENGVVWPDEPPYPDVPDAPYDDRGWWSTRFEAQILFYDPNALAAVAAGPMQPHEPQPYAVRSIDIILEGERRASQRYRTGAMALDARNGILYIMEPHADGDRPIIHVWRIDAGF